MNIYIVFKREVHDGYTPAASFLDMEQAFDFVKAGMAADRDTDYYVHRGTVTMKPISEKMEVFCTQSIPEDKYNEIMHRMMKKHEHALKKLR